MQRLWNLGLPLHRARTRYIEGWCKRYRKEQCIAVPELNYMSFQVREPAAKSLVQVAHVFGTLLKQDLIETDSGGDQSPWMTRLKIDRSFTHPRKERIEVVVESDKPSRKRDLVTKAQVVERFFA